MTIETNSIFSPKERGNSVIPKAFPPRILPHHKMK